MKNNAVSIAAFVIVLVGILVSLTLVAVAMGILETDWIDLEPVVWVCFGLSILGCALGWFSFKCPLGKASAILGTLLVAGYLCQLLRSDPGRNPELKREPEEMSADRDSTPDR